MHGANLRILAAAGFFLVAGLAMAQPGHEGHGHGEPAAGKHAPGEPAAEHARKSGEHAAGGHDEHPLEINWDYGFLGESDEEEPGLLYRPKGMPMPVVANIVNSALLIWLIVHFGKKPVTEGLAKRKARIVAGMEEAAKMKAEAEAELDRYEQKLKHIEDEIARVRREMRESAEAERKRILAEAKDRRARMERDARLLVEQELKATREELVRQAVDGAVRSAEQLLAKELSATDHQRLADEYLGVLQKQGAGTSLGGRS